MRAAEQHGIALGQVLELAVLLNDDMAESLARDDLTVSRARVLWALRHQGPSTQRVLAEALDVSPRNITGLVDALVATGFVTRQRHPSDRRATLVSLTTRGDRMATQMVEGRAQLAELLFSRMSDEEFDGLVAGLAAVLVRLREELSMVREGRR